MNVNLKGKLWRLDRKKRKFARGNYSGKQSGEALYKTGIQEKGNGKRAKTKVVSNSTNTLL